MRKKPKNLVKLANPVSTDYSIIRTELLPSLLKNLAVSKHHAFPQKMFEVSDVITLNENSETYTERKIHLAAVSSHPSANFTEIKSILESLLRNLNCKDWTIEVKTDESFIQGRSVKILIKNVELGIVGEIHPEVLNNFELENPTCAFELDLQDLVN
jgi:phenylalanyl-tRNA synthetase beta chain